MYGGVLLSPAAAAYIQGGMGLEHLTPLALTSPSPALSPLLALLGWLQWVMLASPILVYLEAAKAILTPLKQVSVLPLMHCAPSESASGELILQILVHAI